MTSSGSYYVYKTNLISTIVDYMINNSEATTGL